LASSITPRAATPFAPVSTDRAPDAGCAPSAAPFPLSGRPPIMIDQTPKVPKALKTPQAPTVKPDPAAAPEPDAGTGGALGPDAGESRPNRRLPGRRDPRR